MKQRFLIEEDFLTPNELIKRLLTSPIDLIWNGGIGTYIKASSEQHSDVGDKANDVLRVDALDVRAKVIGEGGNLGLTQLARIEFAQHGGRSFTDFIDNAAGVDCSDHEFNIKILLDDLVVYGDLSNKQRNELMLSMTDEVAELVLNNNYRQAQAIALAHSESLKRTSEYRRLISSMEQQGKLDRELEFLPVDEQIVERKVNQQGLTRPELAVLISYAKGEFKQSLVKAHIGSDPWWNAN